MDDDAASGTDPDPGTVPDTGTVPGPGGGPQAPAQPRPRRRLTQSEAREQTRKALLAAAAEVFARKGFAGASLEEIAEVAGYTTGALYYHFASKQELFVELMRAGWERRTANWAGAAARVVADEAADPYAELSRMLVQRATRSDESGPLQGEFWLYALRNPDAMAVVAEQLREQAAGVRPAVEALMERAGTAPGISADELATVILALFQGLARRRRMDPDSVPDDLFARVLRRLLAP
jgi:AcrR family transcriptional regulator